MSEPQIEQWLDDGGLVVTASERTARALLLSYHQARRAQGMTAWAAPRIEHWQQFLRGLWRTLARDSRMLLEPLQEQSLWATVASTEGQLATTLDASRARLGSLAMDAHSLLCAYAPKYLEARVRASWQKDQASFSNWLTAFDEECRDGQLLSVARLPLELLRILEEAGKFASPSRPPLLLVGFDRIQPSQRQLLDAWGEWREATLPPPAAQTSFIAATDEKTELAACALWCRKQLDAKPDARLIVVAQNLSRNRGQVERAFLRHLGPSAASLFEFSLGVELSRTSLARSAQLLLHWLTQSLEEHELDWLLASAHLAADAAEQTTLQRRMKRLRERGLQRTVWPLDAFATQPLSAPVPTAWFERLSAARVLLAAQNGAAQSPLAWAELTPRLLEAAGWPGGRPLSSAEFQIHRRFLEALDACASLGFAARKTTWSGFLSLLGRVLDETVYAPESADAPILIAGPAETAGLSADAVWFLGASEDAWPAAGSTHPFLPLELQREAGMPHAHPRLDWELAQAITTRLLASTDVLCFSYSHQREDVEAQPSRLALQFAGKPVRLPAELQPPAHPSPQTVPFDDLSRVPFPPGSAPGGADLLTNQSLCPFRAFATARLGARDWEPAEPGLSASQRGTLLHAVLHSVWGGPPHGIRTHRELLAIEDRAAFVRRHVELVFERNLPAGARERMPRRYLALEQQRLASLVREWLEFETRRVSFTVAATELKASPAIAGLALRLRLDRIDLLNDGSLLVVDYKSGDVSPKLWELPRPEDVQLPLYAGFGLVPGEELGGLVFAKVRAGEAAFAGRVGNAIGTVKADISPRSDMAKRPLSLEMLLDWRDAIEGLARDFVAGAAQADPREYPATCERCALPGLCRIREFPPQSIDEADDSDSSTEAGDE